MRLANLLGLLLLLRAGIYADQYTELFRQAAEDTQHGLYDQAIAKYKAALKIRPGAAEALNNLGVMYYQVHKYEEAFATVSGIWAKHPELRSAALIAGMSAVQCNRPKEAIAPLSQLLKSDPKNRDALLALASAQVALNDFAQAAQTYGNEIEYSPTDATAWYGRAICFETLAEDASKRLSKMPGGAGYSKRLLAQYLQRTGDSVLAREAFGDSDTEHPSEEASKQYDLARELAEKSRESFEQLVKISPDSWESLVFLGDVNRQHGDLASALNDYQRAADSQPDSPAPLLGLGTTYWELGQFDHAIEYLQKTLALNPNANQAVFELANIAVRRHSDAEAIPLLIQYLNQQPDAIAAHADLGRAYLHLSQYELAVQELSKAAIADEQGDVNYQLSVALRHLGRTREADATLKKSTEIRQAKLKRLEELHSIH
jgi:tetratricopeptide (TPR) repeat protein